MAGWIARVFDVERRESVAIRAARVGLLVAVCFAGALPVLGGTAQCPVAAVFHRPCPGCGMTRAIGELARGSVHASLRLHPLAIPALLANIAVVSVAAWHTARFGSPLGLLRKRSGRVAIGFAAVTLALVIALFVARELGAFGGPVPVALPAPLD